MLVIRNTVWLSVCRIAADLSGLVLFAVISRRFGPMGTGEYSYAFARGAFNAILATPGIEQYGVRQYACLSSDKERTDCWQSLLVTQSIQLLLGLVVLVAVLIVVGTQRANPLVGATGAVFVVLLSSAVVDVICAFGLRREISQAIFCGHVARLALALALSILTVLTPRAMGIGAWQVAIAACLMFPLVGLMSGLFPNPRHSPLFA